MNSTSIVKDIKTIKKQHKKKHQKKQHRQQKKLQSSIIPIATNTPTILITPSLLPTTSSYSSSFSPLPTVNEEHVITEPVNIDNNQDTLEQDTLEQDTSTIDYSGSEGISAAVISGIDPAATIIGNSSKAVHIAGPIVGVFAGVAFIAAAMFLVVRNRKKRQLTTINNDDDDNENKFQDISLDDEAITIPPPLLKKSSVMSTTTDYYSLTDTLIGSTRTKKQQSWQSSIDNRLSDVVSPTSTLVGNHINSFLMVAERQQLQHERPSILDHFDKRIETYKAQLANIMNTEEDEEEEEPLPFISIINLNDYYV